MTLADFYVRQLSHVLAVRLKFDGALTNEAWLMTYRAMRDRYEGACRAGAQERADSLMKVAREARAKS